MRIWTLAPVALAMALPMTALADDAASVKKQVDANFTKMMSGFNKHDIKGVMSIVADDYEGVGMDGKKTNKAHAQAEMQQHMSDTKKVRSYKFTVAGLKVQGDKATGKVRFDLDCDTVDAEGMMGPKGKTHHLVLQENSTNTWSKSGGKWLLSKELPAGPPKMTVDGKAFNPMAPPPTPTRKK